MRQQKGFTLIEILVAIAIIGLLAALTIVSLSSSKAKGRDAARKSDIEDLAQNMELYFGDLGQYPLPIPSGELSPSLDVLVSEEYVGALPEDPLNESLYIYTYKQVGDVYVLSAKVENANRDSQHDGGYDADAIEKIFYPSDI